jgi:2-polyprenyl-3-methyl-5-hydroxy-6-metoxy-1,4-benzoquinol methylase
MAHQVPVEILRKYFSWPYGGHVFIFTNKVTLADVQERTFTEILSHQNARDAHGLAGHSVALAIFEAVAKRMNGLDGKKVLDIGGNTGYFSFLATEAGATVTMV